MAHWTENIVPWTPEIAAKYKAAFYEFLNYCQVKGKEVGYVRLGGNLLTSQVMVIDAVFDGLANDKHDFKILKSRQLGVSTIVRALGLFWNGMFEITSALMFDDGKHLEEARQELVDMLQSMPARFQFPRKKQNNRYHVSLQNGSRISFMSAGVKKSNAGGGLGAGSAITMAHRSELCNYGDADALENFRHSLARANPNRLFIDESTARGYNLWYDIWEDAKNDDECVCVFIGWWAHQGQVIAESHPDFRKYTATPLTDEEKRKIRIIKERYGHEITAPQIAWIRKEMSDRQKNIDDGDEDFAGDPTRLQNQPWIEEDSFQQSGSTFFPTEALTEQTNKYASNKFEAYYFAPGFEFTDLKAYDAKKRGDMQLKVWEVPVEGATYILSCDPAYGSNEMNDRSCIQMFRAYSDGLDQVAEYAWPLINTEQLAWVIVALEAWYAGGTSDVFRIVEINGPGEATWRELMSLKQKVAYGYFGGGAGETGVRAIMANTKNYFFARSDSKHPGQSFHFKTTTQLKIAIMERTRDFLSNGVLRIRSHDTLGEMRIITREGDNVAPSGYGAQKDDRVMGVALACRCWEDRVRRTLMARRATRDAEAAKRRLSVVDQVKLFNESQFSTYLAEKARGRRQDQIAQLRATRWGGR